MQARRLLKWLLRIEAICMGSAFLAALLPVSWIVAINDWAGLGPFEATPLMQYFARSLSLLYGIYGSLMWITSGDLDRFRPVITYMAAAAIFMSLALLAIDLSVGMPAAWTALEALVPAAGGVTVLALQRWIRHSTPA